MSFGNHPFSYQGLPLHHFTDLPPPQSEHSPETTPPPNWLNTALLRSDTDFLNLHTTVTSSVTAPLRPDPAAAAVSAAENNQRHPRATATDDNDRFCDVISEVNAGDGAEQGTSAVGSGDSKYSDGENMMSANNWQRARYKAEILAHPLYEQLLAAHVACLRLATPVDQLPRIDAQLSQSQGVVAKYSYLGGSQGPAGDEKDLTQFMTHYVLLLCSFKEQLQQHVRVHAMEAVMACWEIEQSLQTLTGVSPGESMGATMSDDEDDDQVDSDANLFNGNLEGSDCAGFGPFVLTESEKSLMERVRQELKHELKQGYKEKIVDIREEILRKRRAGKLPGDTTSVLKAWWQAHAKWPYPTEEDKAKLVEETGLELKQINNWFINQRKRNWHSNSSSSTGSKNKRKR